MSNQYNWVREFNSSGDVHAIMEGKKIVSFSYCNYLGLNNEIRLKNAMKNSLDNYGTGINCSPMSCGTMHIHKKLEKELADFVGGEDCILYPLGYLANLGVISSLVGQDDILIVDELSHASIIDGCMLSKGQILTYKHSDINDLEKKLKNSTGDKLIVTDGVFSMDGDIAKLDEIYSLSKKYNAGIFLDDAHGIGVLGQNGGGTPEYFGLKWKIDLVMGTMTKALAVQGGYVVGSKKIIKHLRYASRPFVFNVSLQPYLVEGVREVLKILKHETGQREKLWHNTNYIRGGLLKLGFNLKNSTTPIIPILIRDGEKTTEMAKFLLNNGIFVDSIFYPLVKKKDSMLRIMISAGHTKDDLDKLVYYLEEAMKI